MQSPNQIFFPLCTRHDFYQVRAFLKGARTLPLGAKKFKSLLTCQYVWPASQRRPSQRGGCQAHRQWCQSRPCSPPMRTWHCQSDKVSSFLWAMDHAEIQFSRERTGNRWRKSNSSRIEATISGGEISFPGKKVSEIWKVENGNEKNGMELSVLCGALHEVSDIHNILHGRFNEAVWILIESTR